MNAGQSCNTLLYLSCFDPCSVHVTSLSAHSEQDTLRPANVSCNRVRSSTVFHVSYSSKKDKGTPQYSGDEIHSAYLTVECLLVLWVTLLHYR